MDTYITDVTLDVKTPNIIRLFDYADAPYSCNFTEKLNIVERCIPKNIIKEMDNSLSIIHPIDNVFENMVHDILCLYNKLMLMTLDTKAKLESSVTFNEQNIVDKFIWLVTKYYDLFKNTYSIKTIDDKIVDKLSYYVIICLEIAKRLENALSLRGTSNTSSGLNYVGDINHINIYTYNNEYINRDVNFYMGCYQSDILGIPAGVTMDFGKLKRKCVYIEGIDQYKCTMWHHVKNGNIQNDSLPYVKLMLKNVN